MHDSDYSDTDVSKIKWVVDNDPSSRYPLYTRANIGEVFPTVVMPFSWSLWGIPHSEPGWGEALVKLGAFHPEEFTDGQMEMLGVFGGYGYLNVSASRIFGVRTPGLTAEAIDQGFFGEQPDVPPYQPAPEHEDAALSAKLGEMLNWVFTATELPDLMETRSEMQALRAARPDLARLSPEALLDRTRALCARYWRPLWVRHIMATYHAMIPSGVISNVCAAIGRPELAADLMTGVGDVESAKPARALWGLGRFVSASPELMALFDQGVDTVMADLAAGESLPAELAAFATRFQVFMAEFGFRGPNEWEMRSRCWELDPATPLTAIDQMRRAAPDQSPDARAQVRAQARERALSEVRAALPEESEERQTFEAAIAASRVFFAGRERTKTNCAMLAHEMRMPMWRLGALMVADGRFKQPDQFALLTDEEWTSAMAGELDVAVLVRSREAEEACLAGLEPPFIVDAKVPPLATWKTRGGACEDVSVGTQLNGQPGCAGVVEGVARIILDPSDPGDMEPGDILITEFTDPSWTPLFTAAGGVVVNVGATVSHAVIVARELGVPCAISVTGATERIPDGAQVRVDGATGTVTVLALPQA